MKQNEKIELVKEYVNDDMTIDGVLVKKATKQQLLKWKRKIEINIIKENGKRRKNEVVSIIDRMLLETIEKQIEIIEITN